MEFQFKTAIELLELTARHDLAVSEITLRAEAELQQISREELLAKMLDYYRRMKESVRRLFFRRARRMSGGDR